MQQSVCTTYNVWISPFFRELQCTLYLKEVGICIIPKHTSSFGKIYIHKNLLIECKKEIISLGNQKRKTCIKLNYFKISRIYEKNTDFKVLKEASLSIFLSSDQEVSGCIKAIEHFFQNASQESGKPYLVFVNPSSGSKNALNNFNTKVVPIWEKMNISYELFCTEYAGHAENTVTNLSKTDLLCYRAIVACSGDGLVNEIINGLLSRSDYAHISAKHTIKIGILPSGSANSTAASICHHSGLFGNSSLLLHCAFLLTLPNENIQVNPCDWSTGHNEHWKFTLPVLPYISPLNGIRFGTCDANFHRFGIQSIEWGLFSDVDYKSERLRWMGEKRFLLYISYYIIKKPKYRAKLSYLPLDNLLPKKVNCTNDEPVQASSVLELSSMECGKLDDLSINVNESREPVKKSCKSWS
ncbi:Sphingosine kinase 1 [Schistosoma japonicum]|nr:Ceramide kinase [Schistosoma japonicum]TNN12347.1 Sphingosine kinase 1 [Schistosoma japonicum]